MAQAIVRAGLAAALAVWATGAFGLSAAAQQDSQSKPRTWEERVPPQASPPPIVIEPPSFEAGDLRPGEKRDVVFRLTNTGERDVALGEVRSSCWCATGRLSSQTIRPGETVTMEASVEAPPDPGLIERAIFVFADGYAQPATISLHADVNYGIRYRIEYASPDELADGRVHLESVDGAPFRVLSADLTAPVFLDGFDPTADAARASYVIAYDVHGAPLRMRPPWFIIETDHPESPVMDLPLEGYEEERRLRPWIMSERRILLGVLTEGATEDFVVVLRGLRSDPLTAIEDIRLEPEEDRLTLLGLLPGDEGLHARFRFRADGTDGLICTRVVVRANGHEEELYLLGRRMGK